MKTVFRLSIVSAVAVGPLITAAYAQSNYYSRDKYEAVMDRRQPEFDAEPIRVGSLIVRSSAEAGITSTSNVFAASTGEQSDTIVRLGVRADATSDWTNHEVGVRFAANRQEYNDFSSESSTNVQAAVRGRLDVTKSLALTGTVFGEDGTESRTDFANAVGSDRPIGYQRYGVGVGANYQADRIRWDSTARFTEADYDDGTANNGVSIVPQDFRDHSVTNLNSRVSYAINPDLAVYGQGSYRSSDYDNPQYVDSVTGQILNPNAAPLPATAVERVRDSDTYTLSGGVNFELQSLIRGDVSVGYMTEDKKDSNLQDVDTLSANGRVLWFPSRLTTVTFDVAREVRDLGLVDSSSAIQTRFSVNADHELRRNVIVSLYGRIADNDYEDIDRSEEITEFGIRGRYKLNKRIHFDAFARRIDREVSGAQVVGNPGFDANIIGIGVRVFP